MGGDTQRRRLMEEFDLRFQKKAIADACLCEANKCVKLLTFVLVQPLVREYIGAKFGVVG
ncbi:hypothetical protein ORS3428_06165 [Mesorhizobium sp. ORS 3428]|nr:hypothetical protein ORS3428_06165 [Mesorhizobium sp. ORS 3428]